MRRLCVALNPFGAKPLAGGALRARSQFTCVAGELLGQAKATDHPKTEGIDQEKGADQIFLRL